MFIIFYFSSLRFLTCRYFDYDGNLKGKSSMMAIGPEFEVLAQEVIVTEQKREVKLAVMQLAGKPCPDLWVGMYFQGDVNLYATIF